MGVSLAARLVSNQYSPQEGEANRYLPNIKMDQRYPQSTNSPCRGRVTAKKDGESTAIWVGTIDSPQHLAAPPLHLVDEGLHLFEEALTIAEREAMAVAGD